jgi:hypothetical protein
VTCDETRGLLSAELDGELPAAESEAVHAHLGSCADCGRQSALLRGTRDAFRAAGRRPPLPRSIAAAALAGALALGVVAGWGHWRASGSPDRPTPSAPVVAGSAMDLSAPQGAGRAATDGIDCGRPDAAVCIVDLPCGDGRCGGLLEQLRAHSSARPALDARPSGPGRRRIPPQV